MYSSKKKSDTDLFDFKSISKLKTLFGLIMLFAFDVKVTAYEQIIHKIFKQKGSKYYRVISFEKKTIKITIKFKGEIFTFDIMTR